MSLKTYTISDLNLNCLFKNQKKMKESFRFFLMVRYNHKNVRYDMDGGISIYISKINLLRRNKYLWRNLDNYKTMTVISKAQKLKQ